MDSTLVLGPEYWEEPGGPVTYTSYKEEKPILSGALILEVDWIPYKGAILQMPSWESVRLRSPCTLGICELAVQ